MKKYNVIYAFKYRLICLRLKLKKFQKKYFKQEINFISGTGSEELVVFSATVSNLREAEDCIGKLQKIPPNISEIYLLKTRTKDIVKAWYPNPEGSLQGI